MAELGKRLGKLSLAILENFVEKTLGEKFVDELRKPTDKVLAMEAALEKSEQRFVGEFPEKEFSGRMFEGLSDKSLGSIVDAIKDFYDHPAGIKIQNTLNRILSESFQDVYPKLISSAVELYINILTEEFILADEKFRENVHALADLQSMNILRKVEALLSQREVVKVETTTFRTLHQLPQPPADFTGREEIIDQLIEDFNTHKGATITGTSMHGLTGMGGIGKTALGLIVTHKISDEYPDAQIFLDLKGTTEPLSAMDIMRHVILSFEPAMDLRALGETNMQGAYRSVLHGKRALLFLDNARSAGQVAPLQPPDGCALLVTSRWIFPVPGLQSRHLDVLSHENAEKFLVELCPRIGERAGGLAQACARLPLALRIAGSFLQVNEDWQVEKYIAGLKDHKHRLETLQHNREEAELQTEPDLLATFELSYNQLSEEAQKHWRRLGVFPTSFDAQAVRALWDLEEEETLKLLGLLRRYSLLDYDETSTRYSLHDLLKDYACSQMNHDEDVIARTSHYKYYSDLLYNINQMYLRGAENILPALRLYDTEWLNIEAGQRASVLYLEENKTAAQACNWYAGQGSINGLRLRPKDQIKWLEDGIRASRILENRGAEGHHLGNLGLAYAALGEARKAIEYYEQALVIDREIGDRRGEGNALSGLGVAYAALGEARKAIEYYEGHLKIAREIGDRRGEGNALGNLGNAYADLGDARKAIEYHERDLKIAREIGNRRGESTALGNLGVAYADLGEARKAIEYYEGYLKIAREIGDRRGEGNALFNMGLALYSLEEKDRAIELVGQALAIFEAIESPSAETARSTLKEWGALPKGEDSQAG